MMMKELYVFDLETYPNFFLASFKNVYTGEWFEFEISDRKTDIKKLYRFLDTKNLKLIGFNNVNFDYPVLHNSLIRIRKNWNSYDIYEEVKKVIKNEYSSIWEKEVKIPQLDLYRIWHYDNKNKRTSLKWLEFAMRMHNVEDLPYAVGSILTNDQKDNVIKYCRNDINATEVFYHRSKKHIEIRKFYTKKEGINLINASETKISKEIFAKYLSKELNISIKELKKLRTERDVVQIKDVIFPYIKFEHKQNIKLLEDLRNSKWYDKSEMSKSEKKRLSINFEIDYLNIKRVCGEGGIHSFSKPGVYESNEEYMVYDLDFASYYPHLCFKNKLHPAHIPEELFNSIYEGFYKERKLYPKTNPINYVLKIILNAAYGLSKDKHAYLYDPKWQLAIVINGQLLLAMLTEWVVESTSYCKILFENTDGAAFIIKRSEKHLVDEVCKKMEELSGIGLEMQECQKLIMRDVNNYINIISNDNVKYKGAFEIDRDYHKNHSKRIVPLALAEYFIKNTKPEFTIKRHLSSDKVLNPVAENYGIFDFCLGVKMTGQNTLHSRKYSDGKIVDSKLGKVTRYYVSNQGVELIKKLPPLEKNYISETDKQPSNQINMFDFIEDDFLVEPEDRETNIEAGWKCKVFNEYKEYDYDINYKYYINEVNKIIKAVENG